MFGVLKSCWLSHIPRNPQILSKGTFFSRKSTIWSTCCSTNVTHSEECTRLQTFSSASRISSCWREAYNNSLLWGQFDLITSSTDHPPCEWHVLNHSWLLIESQLTYKTSTGMQLVFYLLEMEHDFKKYSWNSQLLMSSSSFGLLWSSSYARTFFLSWSC